MNTLLEISLAEYLCFICKGTILSLEKQTKNPISLIHKPFSYHLLEVWLMQVIQNSNCMVCER